MKDLYKIELTIAPDGEDEIEFFYSGTDVVELKTRTPQVILELLKGAECNAKECLVNATITRNGHYYDHDNFVVEVVGDFKDIKMLDDIV